MSTELDRAKNYIEFQITQHNDRILDLKKKGEAKSSKLYLFYQESINALNSELESLLEKRSSST
jgi:hypothetical protein